MKTVQVRITLELESSDRKSVYKYLKELIDDESLDYDVVPQEDIVKRHPLADL